MAEERSERLCRCSCLVCLVTVPVCSCGSCFCAGQDSRPEEVAGDTHSSSQRQLNLRHRSARGWSQCLLSGDIQVFSRGEDVQILARQAVGLPLLSIHPDTLNLLKQCSPGTANGTGIQGRVTVLSSVGLVLQGSPSRAVAPGTGAVCAAGSRIAASCCTHHPVY